MTESLANARDLELEDELDESFWEALLDKVDEEVDDVDGDGLEA